MNTVNIIGNIGHDLELRTVANGKSVLSFNIAVRAYGDKTDWFRVTVWEKQAENTARFCKKGSKIGVTGSLTTNEFTNKEGQEVKTVEIRGLQIDFLDTKEERGEQSGGGYQKKETNNIDPFEKNGNPIDISDDDLPF